MFATSSSVHQRRMYAMLSAINTMENSLGIRLVNKGDDIQQLQYSFSGLPEVMDSAMMDMAGATGIPVTRLFGRSPAGMNSTGESDERMYRQALEQERSIHVMPVLERLIPIVCRSAIGYFPAGCKFKLPALLEIPPDQKAQLIDQRVGVMERLFQANLVPGDAVLEALRTAQQEMEITSNITDDYIDHVKGKYFNDLQQQADPYGGAMQTASEAGVDSGTEEVDESGNPIEPTADQEGQQEVDENAIPEQSEEPETPEERRAIEKQYEAVTKSVDPEIAQNSLLQVASVQNLSPEELRSVVRKQAIKTKKEQQRMKEYEKIIKSVPAEVSQDIVAKMSAEQQLPIEEFAEQMNQQQEALMQMQQEEQGQEQMEQEQQEQEQQRKDHNSLKYRKIKHLSNREDEDFRYEKFRKSNSKNRRDRWN
jgi:hypothetical protein